MLIQEQAKVYNQLKQNSQKTQKTQKKIMTIQEINKINRYEEMKRRRARKKSGSPIPGQQKSIDEKLGMKPFDKVILSAPMLGFKNELILFPLINICELILPREFFMFGSRPNMGREVPFDKNDLSTDKKRYMRTLMLVRKNKDIRLWGITVAFAIAVKRRLLELRKNGWAESINNQILFINSINDSVVSSKHISEMSKRLKNAQIINFEACEHELFMEKDIHREKMWNKIDKFLNLPLDHDSLTSR